MYHRITPPSEVMQAGMYVRPKTFRNHLKLLKKYFVVVPLDKLFALLEEDKVNGNVRPLCALTFDDGWKDFYDFAFPLLKEYEIPATVFLPTGFINTKKQFWTDYFAYLFYHRKTSLLGSINSSDTLAVVEYLEGLRGSFENRLEAGINHIKRYPLSKIEKILVDLSEIWSVDVGEISRDFLNWQEITEMRDSGLVAFGSHTVSHQILTTLDGLKIKKELIESKKELLRKKLVDDTCISFCYPNGNYTSAIAGLVQASGYHLAVTTKNGWNCVDDNRFTLRRIGIHEDMTATTALFASRLAEFF